MKPPAFDLVRAESLEEALATLAEAGDDARILAGGQSLGPMLNMRLAQPEVVVDIGGIPGLSRIEWADGALMLTAGVTQAAVLADPHLAERQPLLAEAMPWIGHVQTRARGTVCGSLANADPAAELPLLLAMMGGAAIMRSAKGQRGVPARGFFQGMFETALQPDEMLYAVRFDPLPDGAGVAFREVAERHGDFAILAAAAIADKEVVRLGLGGVADRPVVAQFKGMTPKKAPDALAELSRRLDPRGDPKASAEYRRRLIRTVGLEVVLKAMERRDAV